MKLLLYPRPLRWWNRFMPFYVCHSTMGLHTVREWQFFTFIFAVFLSQSTAMIPWFQTNGHCWNYTSGFDFGPTVSIGLQILSQLDDRRWSCDVKSISKITAVASQIYFRFQFWWRIAFKNVQIYSHTKFRQDSSIRGSDITISFLWKTIGRHIEILLSVSLWRFHCHRCVILGRRTKFYPNRTIGGWIMTS